MRYRNCSCFTSLYCVVSLLIELSSLIIAASIKETLFRVATGFKLSQGTQMKTEFSNSISAIFCSSICSSECASATYSVKHKTCITFVEKFYNSSIVWSQDPDWVVLYRDEQRVQYGDWTMVFRAQKEVNISIYDVWTAKGQHDDSPLSSGVLNGCYRLDNLGGCKRHFRSSVLDYWSSITLVKFSVYVNGSEVNYIVFNGSSTTRDSWFQRSNILTSSWTGIKTDVYLTDFSISGLLTNTINRRFVISGRNGQCSTDKMYFLAVDQTREDCDTAWSISISNFPVFVSSKDAGNGRVQDLPKEIADVMAVFVKF